MLRKIVSFQGVKQALRHEVVIVETKDALKKALWRGRGQQSDMNAELELESMSLNNF